MLRQWSASSACRQVYPKALDHPDRALELDPELAEAYATRGHIRLVHLHEWQAALADYDTAIRLDPRYAEGHMWRGFWLCFVGRCEDGIAALETAHALEPDSLALTTSLARTFFWSRRYDEAAQRLERVLEIESVNTLAIGLLGRIRAYRDATPKRSRCCAAVPRPLPAAVRTSA